MIETDSVHAIKPADLPSPPQVAIQIMRACARDDVSFDELSDLIASDPILTAEVMRIVNSAFYGFSREVQAIPHAMTVLGLRALRNLVLCISVRDALKQEDVRHLDIAAYWEDAIRRAVAARLLGGHLNVDGDECFTAGLLQDFGLLVMLALRPDKAGLWPALRTCVPDARVEMEREAFKTTHAEVGMMLARAWALPSELADAIAHHHDKDTRTARGKNNALASVLYAADWLASVYSAHADGALIDGCRSALLECLGLDSNQADDCLAAMPGQVEVTATALGLRIAHQPDFEELQRQASVKLAEENLSYQELTWRLENTLTERDRLAAELDRELELAREIQRSLLPPMMPADFPVTAINVSARELSGDFYDFYPLDDGHLYFALGDVSGKGINAALLMAKTGSLFRCLGKHVHDPSRLMAQINAELCETSIRGMFVTMLAGLYHPASGRLRLVNAGHVPALLRSPDGTVNMIEAQAPPLGIVLDSEFPETAASLAGGSLYVYSDGVTEGHIAGGRMLGSDGLLATIAQLGDLPPQQRLEAIVARFEDPSAPLRDDITVLVVEEREQAI